MTPSSRASVIESSGNTDALPEAGEVVPRYGERRHADAAAVVADKPACDREDNASRDAVAIRIADDEPVDLLRTPDGGALLGLDVFGGHVDVPGCRRGLADHVQRALLGVS